MDEALYRELAERLKEPAPTSIPMRTHEFAIDMSFGFEKGAWGAELFTTRDGDNLKTWSFNDELGRPDFHNSVREKWESLTIDDIDNMVYRKFLRKEAEDCYRLTGDCIDLALHPLNRIYTPMIFISYKHGPSSPLALLIAHRIKEEIIGTPYFDLCLRSVKKQSVQLQKEVELCDVFVCVLDENTLLSKSVRKEINWALGKNRPIISIWHQKYKAGQKKDKPHDSLKAIIDDYPATTVEGKSAEKYHLAVEKLMKEIANARNA